ncbi:hypothetical protein [Lutibacter sp.]
MKKIGIQIIAFTLLLALFTACKSTKKGCGLTSDATKVEQSKTVNS